MTKALRRDPLALYTQLQARRVDLASALRVSRRRNDEPRVTTLVDAMARVDAALEKTVARLSEIAAAEEEVEVEEGIDSDDEGEAEAEEGTEEAEVEEEEPLETPDGSLGPIHSDEADDPGLQHQDKLPEEEVVAEEENPVAMKAGLRRDVGDLTADFLDNYSLAIHTKVIDFFDSLNEKALDLGEEDASDGETSLRELLRVEVGKRGLSRFEPVFAEWRADLIKKLSKTINEMFALPEEPSPLAPPMPTLNKPDPVQPAPPKAPDPVQPAPAQPSVAAVQANGGRVSFVVRDFVPSGARVVAKME